MGQSDILDFLRANKGSFFSSKNIVQYFGGVGAAKSFSRVRKYAVFYNVKVKQKRFKKYGSPSFLLGFSK